MGISQNDLDDMIVDVAKENHLQYNDWRQHPVVTAKNHTTTLGDHDIHPTQATMNLMADRYYNKFFKSQTATEQQSSPSVHHTNTAQLALPLGIILAVVVLGVIATFMHRHNNS